MYTPYLIANFETGVDRRLQPWLSPDDAQQELLDGYVYRGTMSKRDGYNYLAIGERGGSTYRESRIVHTLTAVAPSTGVIDGANKTFTFVGTAQIARGSVTITGSSPVQVVTDNGLGILIGAGTGTVNYITGAISVTFTTAPDVASTVLLTYSFMPGNPVMMIASFYTSTNDRQLIVADTQYVNRYNTTTNTLQDITTNVYTGNKFNFFSWTNYPDATDNNRLLFVNNKDVIQSYDGTTIIDYAPTITGVTLITCLLMVQFKDRLILLRTTEDGTIFPRRIRVSGIGNPNCDNFDSTAIGAGIIEIPDNTWIYGAAFNRDDLMIFTEGSTWSLKYTGNDSTPFVLVKLDESRGSQAPFAAITYLNRTSAVSPRGLIITDGYQVERQDLNIPDFSYNEISAARESNEPSSFELCFAGSVDADRDHYLIYPTQNQAVPADRKSLRILTTNYDEDNYSIYRLPLSCMGTYVTSFNVTWDDLFSFPNWEDFSNSYENWNSFAYSDGAPFSVGGGHHGEIWKLAVTESEDNVVRIRNITIIDSSTIEVTTDWNNYSQNNNTTGFGYGNEPDMGNDYIFLTAIQGMVEVNNKQYPIKTVVSHNVFRLDIIDGNTSSFSAYTSGGTSVRVIPFDALMKQFNPFVGSDKKVRCGWLYMYVDTTGTNLTENLEIININQSNPGVVTTQDDHNLTTGKQVFIFGVGGMVEVNGLEANITVLSPNTFAFNGVDTTGFTAYTSGGYASTSVPATISIDVYIDDRNDEDDGDDETQLGAYGPDPYQGNCTNMTFVKGTKKWYKVYINQTGKFIQFRFRNQQAGTIINIQACMPGFQPVGRLI